MSLEYKFTFDSTPELILIVRNQDGILTWGQEVNQDFWAQYQNWLAEGNTTLAWDQPWTEAPLRAESD